MMNTARRAFARLRAAKFTSFSSKPFFPVLLPAVLCFAMVWPFGGGWKTVNLMAGADSPAAQGVIKYKTSGNGNTALQIETRSLAPPSSLTPPENAYVVWIRPPGQATQNLGELKVNDKEQSNLNTETAFKRFHIFITAEQNAQIQEPQGPTVLSADVAR